MVARSRSSLMCLQSERGENPNYDNHVHEDWLRALEHSRQRLKSRCKHLEDTFGPKSGRRTQGFAPPHGDKREPRRIEIPTSEIHSTSPIKQTPCSKNRYTKLSGEDRYRPATPRRIIINEETKGEADKTPRPRFHAKQYKREDDYTATHSSVASISSSLRCYFEDKPKRRYSPQSSVSFCGYSEKSDGAHLVPLDVILACKLGLGESTPSYNRSFTLIDCPEQPTAVNRGNNSSHHHRNQGSRQRKQTEPDYKYQQNYQRNSCDRYWSRKNVKPSKGHRQQKQRRTRHRMTPDNEHIMTDEAATPSSIEEVGRAATSCIGATRPTVVHRSGQSQSVPRPLKSRAKIDADYIERIASGNVVNMELLKAPQLGSSDSIRYTISICREIFMGVVGAQIVYAATSLMFGNIAAAVIVSLLCVQGAFCHCDGRPVAYVINGFLCFLVGTTVVIALFRNVSGLEPYHTEPVLHTMSYFYVPLCYLFGCFSFFLAYSYHGLYKQERQAIVQAVNRLVGERYRVNEHSLALERKS